MKRSKIVATALSLVMLISITSVSVFAENTPNQNAEGYYELASAKDFDWFAQESINTPSIKGILTKDIDISNNTHFIGNNTTMFAGTLDGNGHAITVNIDNTSSTDPTNTAVGLITYAEGATIKDLTINGSIKNAINTVETGAFVGYGNGPLTLQNLTNNASIIAVVSLDSTSGIIGRANPLNGAITIDNCTNNGNIDGGSSKTAGILASGANAVGGTVITNCINTGNVTGSGFYVGGIAGWTFCTSIDRCANLGGITNTNNVAGTYVGGVCAFTRTNNIDRLLSNCYNGGKITGGYNVGGIAGLARQVVLKNCYNSCEVTSTVANALIGSLVGTYQNTFTAENSYYLENTSPFAVKGADFEGCTKVTANELKALSDSLGSAYVDNSKAVNPVNNGYPILTVQQCIHDFKKEIINDSTLRTVATIEAPATYWYTCTKCGDISDTEYFEYGEKLVQKDAEKVSTVSSESNSTVDSSKIANTSDNTVIAGLVAVCGLSVNAAAIVAFKNKKENEVD